jgi:hypothetical protein
MGRLVVRLQIAELVQLTLHRARSVAAARANRSTQWVEQETGRVGNAQFGILDRQLFEERRQVSAFQPDHIVDTGA